MHYDLVQWVTIHPHMLTLPFDSRTNSLDSLTSAGDESTCFDHGNGRVADENPTKCPGQIHLLPSKNPPQIFLQNRKIPEKNVVILYQSGMNIYYSIVYPYIVYPYSITIDNYSIYVASISSIRFFGFLNTLW